MSWTESFQVAQFGGAFWLALGVAFLGVILLWRMRPFLARRLEARGLMILSPDHGAEREESPAIAPSVELEEEMPVPAAAAVPPARALAAYAAHAGGESSPISSSFGAEEPIPDAVEVAVHCPPELSRRIDRIEARIRARRIGIRV